MADFPALPLYTDAYMADTLDLSLEEHGCYLKMLMIAWRSPDCRLPNDNSRLARMLGLSTRAWSQRFRPTMMRFWTEHNDDNGSFLEQKRLRRERDRVEKKREQRRTAGEASAAAKSQKGKETGSTSVGTKPPTKPPRDTQRSPNETPTKRGVLPEDQKPEREQEGEIESVAEAGAGFAYPDPRVLEVGHRVLRICGVEPSGFVGHFGVVVAWLKAGFDPEIDIYPVVERLSRRERFSRPHNSLEYFRDAVAEAHQRRLDGTKPNGKGEPETTPLTDDRKAAMYRRYVQDFVAKGAWPRDLGDPPGGDDCWVPEGVRDEFPELFGVTDRDRSDDGQA